MASEFVIRASGADKAATKHLVCRFPLTFRPDASSEATAQAPDLKRDGESWSMGQMEEAEARPGTRGLPGQWVLEEQAGRPRFLGQPEGGGRDTGAGYFLLMKGKGNEFLAVPVSDVFTFKPALQRRNQSLEDAEAAMQAQRLQHERAAPRLAKAVARDADPLAVLRDDDEPAHDEADSDEEWKGIKKRAAALQNLKHPPQQQPQQQQQQQRQQQQQQKQAGSRSEEEQPDQEDHAERSDKGEDWEHEDVAADDDVEMGNSEDEEAGSPARKGVASSDSEEEGGLQPDKAKKRLKRMMKETGLEDSEEGSEEEEGGEEESESIMDEEDLDRMAGVAPREPTPETQLKAAREEGAAAGGRKRKSPTPPPASAVHLAAAGGGAAAAAGEQGAKRPRTGTAAPAGTAAAATAAAASAAAPPAAAAAAALRPAGPVAVPAASGGTVTAEELKQLLRSKGRILLADLTAMYKSRLTPEGHKQFVQLVKQVAKIEPGSKYLVLKD